jgi:hypothetical protein
MVEKEGKLIAKDRLFVPNDNELHFAMTMLPRGIPEEPKPTNCSHEIKIGPRWVKL